MDSAIPLASSAGCPFISNEPDVKSTASIFNRTTALRDSTDFDLMIVPARSSVLPIGRSIHVGALAHPLMVNDRRVLRLVENILSEPI